MEEGGSSSSLIFREKIVRSGCVSPSLPAAESEHKLCSKNWMAYGEKCYRLSKQSWVWNESEDCEVWRAQMPIIQDLEERVIQKCTSGQVLLGWKSPRFPSKLGPWWGGWLPTVSSTHALVCYGRTGPTVLSKPHQGFISNVMEGTDHLWVGLHLPTSAQNWKRVDRAPLDQLR
ncbi:killer cell lectin-like receptor subfamily B member 1B allele C isoform X3 [Opisthocomus hoazin]|uniref:killer cell lectin-like receptor subfamily B member 1B allele C isoform X3 n=1 Tax=Opisthocomus hoazin TaxID=30419 RepID=UPI003F530407